MDVVRNAVAGGSASLLSQTVVVPVDIVSQKQMMTSQERRPPSIIQLSRDIFAREGIAGFYRGFFASVMVCYERTRAGELGVLCGPGAVPEGCTLTRVMAGVCAIVCYLVGQLWMDPPPAVRVLAPG